MLKFSMIFYIFNYKIVFFSMLINVWLKRVKFVVILMKNNEKKIHGIIKEIKIKTKKKKT